MYAWENSVGLYHLQATLRSFAIRRDTFNALIYHQIVLFQSTLITKLRWI